MDSLRRVVDGSGNVMRVGLTFKLSCFQQLIFHRFLCRSVSKWSKYLDEFKYS